MKINKKYLYLGVVAVLIIIAISLYSGRNDEESGLTQNATTTDIDILTNNSNQGQTQVGSKTLSKTSSTVKSTQTDMSKTPTSQPEIELINLWLAFKLKKYSNVDTTLEKVVFGRGDAAISTGCSGIPNANFSTYLYPGSGICLGEAVVDGTKRGIVAIHMLIENNGNYGFGGNSDVMRLHYLRATSSGKAAHRFAYPISGLGSYYIQPYSSKEVILSFVVPEDQINFDLLFDYKGELSPDLSQNVYTNSSGGIFIDFEKKTVSLINN